MARGVPLDDGDRAPWLLALGQWLDRRRELGESAVLACSALRRTYRDELRAGRPEVRFVQLVLPPAELSNRVRRRAAHFMPATLVASQVMALEPLQPDEPGVVVTASGAPDAVVARCLEALGLT
jgi:gluconokinase